MKTCEKCGYESEENKKIILDDREAYLCSVCRHFAPSNELKEYLEDKIDWKSIESFRKFQNKKNTRNGMENKAKEGKVTSRAAFGYKIENKQLVPEEEKKLTVQKIFMDFLNEDISLNKLAGRYGFSVNGIKKILKNFTYIGKVKFAGQILQGKHVGIISPELFNNVQKKLEKG
mgnify:CR=1 FL=1